MEKLNLTNIKQLLFFVIVAGCLQGCNSSDTEDSTENYDKDTPPTTYSSTMAEVINQYRQAQGLPAVSISTSLTLVAEAHVNDLQYANPVGGNCNLHSWSNQGNWSSCCYTDDHAQAECMWNKPTQITGGLYTGNGYEISAWYSNKMTPNRALESWKSSEGHHDVILNRNTWKNITWNAVGGAVSENYAVVWFGKELDPAGSP